MDPLRNLGFHLKSVSRLWVRLFEQRASQLAMTLSHAKVLVYLERHEGTTQARLAEITDTEPMTLVRLLDRMEKDGWLERRPDPEDRRAYRVFLKPAAHPVLAEIHRIADKARAEALAGLTAEERMQLVHLLDRVQQNLLALVAAAPDTARTGAAPTVSTRARDARGKPHSRRKRAS
ncbi:MAG: MarR family transcriptional regulator [Steroidobacteraceae bacterium]|nr:MarR family transcriptional regulator [Steroidobacteraceae bacterium]